MAQKDVAIKPAYAVMQEQLALAVQVDKVDGASIQRQSVNSILEADSEDALFEAAGVNNSSAKDVGDYIGVPLTVQDVTWHDSTYDDSEGYTLGYFAGMTVTTDRGDEIFITSGSANIVTFMFAAQQRGMIPGIRIAFEKKETGSGNTVYGVTKPAV